MANLEVARVKFEDALRELDIAKPKINFLTILAGDNKAAAPLIAKEIESKLLVILSYSSRDALCDSLEFMYQ